MMPMTSETNVATGANAPRLFPVLLTAATRWEAKPLAKGLGLARADGARWEGNVGGRRVTLLKTGVGAVKTAAALERDFPTEDYGLAISAGLCGAMQEGLRVGDIVADGHGIETALFAPLRETAAALGLRCHFGRILHTNVVLKPAAKRSLGEQHRALACDMETAALRRWAAAKLPVVGARVVLDEVGEELAADAPEGEDAASLARFALSHPARMPELIRTGLRCGRAMRGLTRYLKAYLEAI